MSDSARDFLSNEWNIYRTRFLVKAKQLNEPLAFTDPLGRENRGLPGDYLVESSNGVLRIAPREIFEDVYVILEGGDAESRLTKPSFCVSTPKDLDVAAVSGMQI